MARGGEGREERKKAEDGRIVGGGGRGEGEEHARKRESGERYRRRKTLIGGEKTEKGRQPNGQPGTRKKAAVEEGRADEDSRRMELWKQKQKPVSLAQGCLPERSTWPRSRGNRELESLGYLVRRLREYLSASTSVSPPSFLPSFFPSPPPRALTSLLLFPLPPHPSFSPFIHRSALPRLLPLLPRLGPSLIPPLFFHASQLSSKGGTLHHAATTFILGP